MHCYYGFMHFYVKCVPFVLNCQVFGINMYNTHLAYRVHKSGRKTPIIIIIIIVYNNTIKKLPF